MSETEQNYIRGNQCAGRHSAESINIPIVSNVIAHFKQNEKRQLDTALDTTTSVKRNWAMSDLEAYQTILSNVGNELIERQADLCSPLSPEGKKPDHRSVQEIFLAKYSFGTYFAKGKDQTCDKTGSVKSGFKVDRQRKPFNILLTNLPSVDACYRVFFDEHVNSSYHLHKQNICFEELLTISPPSYICAISS